MMQWDHDLFDTKRKSCDYIFSPGRPAESETTYKITIDVAEDSTKAAFGRYLGCIMIGFMPDEGLEEALLSLRDMLEFYSHKPAPRRARLAPGTIDAILTDKKKRPDLVIA